MTGEAPHEALRSIIERAFAQTPYPGDDALVSGDPSYDPEYRAVANAFRGKDWRELSPAFVYAQRDALPLLTPPALRYFLPAYLLACAAPPGELDTAPLNVALTLARSSQLESAAFTPEEARAILAYLELARAREPAAGVALDYWRGRAQILE